VFVTPCAQGPEVCPVQALGTLQALDKAGGVTLVPRQGLSLRQVQVMGRWKSDMVMGYMYCIADAMWAASAKQQRVRAGFQLYTVWDSLGGSDSAFLPMPS
jgi:hypothetical protein